MEDDWNPFSDAVIQECVPSVNLALHSLRFSTKSNHFIFSQIYSQDCEHEHIQLKHTE